MRNTGTKMHLKNKSNHFKIVTHQTYFLQLQNESHTLTCIKNSIINITLYRLNVN